MQPLNPSNPQNIPTLKELNDLFAVHGKKGQNRELKKAAVAKFLGDRNQTDTNMAGHSIYDILEDLKDY